MPRATSGCAGHLPVRTDSASVQERLVKCYFPVFQEGVMIVDWLDWRVID